MSNYDAKRVVQDFADRTKRNLRFIEITKKEKRGRVHEITQLINSLLGLVVFPQQEFFERIPAIPMDELVSKGWPRPKITFGASGCKDLRQLMRLLRTGIAHFNLRFLADEDNQIVGLVIWNVNKGGLKTWEAEIGIEDLRRLTFRFLELLNSIEDKAAEEMVTLQQTN